MEISINGFKLSYEVCLEAKMKDNQNWSVLCCVRQLCTVICSQMRTVLKFASVELRFHLLYISNFRPSLL